MHCPLEINDQVGTFHAPPEAEQSHQSIEEEGRLCHDHFQGVERLFSRLDLLHFQAQDKQRGDDNETVIDVEK